MAVQMTNCPRELLPEVRAFFGAMYSPEYIMARDASFLAWQFGGLNGRQPIDPMHLKVALVDGKLAGCVGYIPVEVAVGDGTVRGAWAANWMVDDAYRRLGLGPLLMRELSKDFEVTLALGGNSDAHQILPRMGWTDFGYLPRYVCVVNTDAAARLTERGRIDWPVAAMPSLPANGTTVQAVDAFDAGATALWDRTYGSGGAGTRRTAAFLNWRYQRHPNFQYVRLQALHQEQVSGIAVYRFERVRDLPIDVIRIVELIAEPHSAAALIRAIVEAGQARGVALLDFFCSSPRLTDALTAQGFLRGDEPPARELPMLFQPVDRSRAGVLFLANLRPVPKSTAADWYVTTGDGDQDRPS